MQARALVDNQAFPKNVFSVKQCASYIQNQCFGLHLRVHDVR